MPTERLEATLATLAQHLAAGTYELLVFAGEVDARGTWAAWGALSCAAWLADVSDIDIGTARLTPEAASQVCAVIDETNRECAQSGCHARTFLQYDHIQPYTQDGPTVIANLQRLRGPHNRAKNPRRAEPGS